MAKVLTDEIISSLKDKVATLPIETSEIADGAVTAAKADVAGIMNNASNNGKLFGLGGNLINISKGNANDLTKTGFYTGAGVTNAPSSGANDWFLITHENHSGSWAVQSARSWYEGGVWQRGKTNGTWQAWTKLYTRSDVLNQLYPVGSIYISLTLDTAEKVAATLGGGTWTRTGNGTAIVGVDSSQTEFNTVGKTGGAKTVTLTTQQIPSHSHVINYKNVSLGSGATIVSEVGTGYTTNSGSTGGGQAHNNLQPYTTYYMWKRTA